MDRKKGTQGMTEPDRALKPSGISLTRTRAPLSGRAMQLIREIKEQDMNSYLYLLMEDMLFTTAEGLSREKGTPEEIAAEYLKKLYKKKQEH